MTTTVQEAPVAVPDNPFTYNEGKNGLEYLEYQSKMLIPAAPSVGEKRMQFRTIPMRVEKGLEPYDQVKQLFERCQFFENKCERMQQEIDALRQEREWNAQEGSAEVVAEGGKRGRRQKDG